MADETGAANVSNAPEPDHANSVAKVSRDAGDVEMQALKEVVLSLPSQAVKDLLSLGVCPQCIFRLFGIRGHIYSCSSLSPSILCSVLGELGDQERCIKENEDSITPKESEVEPIVCCICLGILQFTYCDAKDMVVKKDGAYDLAISITELVKQEGHEFDSFSLEVSIPPNILENDQAAWLYMKRKHGLELWFQENSLSERISVKDAFKFSIVNPLETLLDIKSGLSSFHIRITYTHSKPSKVQNFTERKQDCKRRKTGTVNGLDTVDESLVADIKCSGFSMSEADAVIERSYNGFQDYESSVCFKFPLEKVDEPCHLAFLCYRKSIYLGGRYLKYSRNVSQTRWIIDDERMGEASIEEIIGGNMLPMCRGDSYKFHAAGREDIDVRMLGSGRPFLVEIQNARHVPAEVFVKEIEAKINNFGKKLVRVNNLKVVGSQGWDLMREGEAEKQKQYAALVWISRPLEDEDSQSMSTLKDIKILQRTPIRVLHRRSPLEREKIIHWMKIERIAGSTHYFLLHLCTQAGTYIKEFVHGDLGRTHPSIGSILGCRAEILQLDVTDVKMDCFLTG